MSGRVDLAEFLSAYVAEVDEQIVAANARVLALEETIRKGEKNPRAVRDLFRALHTIKGLSAMVGVEPVVSIAHRMEAVLRAADRSGAELPAAAIEPLAEGLRAIELRVRALASEKAVAPPPAALLAALDALEAGDITSGAPAKATLDLEPALAGKLAPFERDQLVTALEEGRRAVRLEFAPSPERAAAGHSINSVRERLAPVAEIVKVVPIALEASAQAPTGLAFVLLLVTAEADETLARASGVRVEAIRSLGPRPAPVSRLPIVPAVEPELPEEPADRHSLLRVEVSRVDDVLEKLSTLIVSRSRLTRVIAALGPSAEARELRQIGTDIARQIRELRTSILGVRMVSISEILDRLPLVVRGLRRATGKQVRLEIDPGDAELDKAVAERLFPALLHLVRNAVDHGLEPAEERRAAGKPEEGVIRITATSRASRQLELVVSDDGRGVDAAQVADQAGADVPVSDVALLDLLCRPGLSTRREVTTTSGRGMGMDIVRQIVERLGGELLLATRPGAGSAFTLHVPLTIAIMDAFTTECGAQRFVVPVSSVEEIVEIEPDRIVSAPVAISGGAAQLGMFERRGEAVPLLDLARLFAVPEAQARRALVVRRARQQVAFGLDRVTGQQEVVVRPLTDPLVNVPGVSGATDLGDGRPTLVLDLVALAGVSPRKLLRAAPEPRSLPAAIVKDGRP